MNKFIISFALVVLCLQGHAQKIEADIFGNLEYKSKDANYKANLKEGIFNELIFSDSNDNTITLKSEYIKLKYDKSPITADEKFSIIAALCKKFKKRKNLEITFSADIFGAIILNGKSEVDLEKDILGKVTLNKDINSLNSSIEEISDNKFKYKASFKEATLQKGFFDAWIYKDSQGNEFNFSKETWSKLKNMHGGEEEVFVFLINLSFID